MAKHKIYLLHDTCFDYIVLPKNRSRVGIGNTWNDNGLFQPNGNVFDFIIHYRWNGFFHFCKFQAINYNSRLACGFIGEIFSQNSKFIAHQSIEFGRHYCWWRHPASVSGVFDIGRFSERRTGLHLLRSARPSVACEISNLCWVKRGKEKKAINCLLTIQHINKRLWEGFFDFFKGR